MLPDRDVVSLKALQKKVLVEVYGLEITMRPAQVLATQAWPSGCAELRVTRIVRVDRMGTESAGFPHRNTSAVPVRVSVALIGCLLRSPVSCTVHGPAEHCGVARHDSIQPLAPFPRRVSAPLTILMLTLHGPCQRAAETGGAVVFTVRTADSTERLPPRSAATRYW